MRGASTGAARHRRVVSRRLHRAARPAQRQPTVKQYLAAVKQLFAYLTSGGILEINPAASVRGPKYVVKRGKTPVLSAAEARQLVDSIESNTLTGLRDRALIGLMIYSFARVGATVTMTVGDLFQRRKQLSAPPVQREQEDLRD
jgi:site-specific recombinase XerD